MKTPKEQPHATIHKIRQKWRKIRPVFVGRLSASGAVVRSLAENPQHIPLGYEDMVQAVKA
jgi:hypothetical protein